MRRVTINRNIRLSARLWRRIRVVASVCILGALCVLIYVYMFSALLSDATTDESVTATEPTEVQLSGLYIGYVNQGNIGDDLLYELCSKMLSSRFATAKLPTNHNNARVSLSLLTYLPTDACSKCQFDWSRFDFIVVGGGSLLYYTYLCFLSESSRSSPLANGRALPPVLIFGSGYDDYDLQTDSEEVLDNVLNKGGVLSFEAPIAKHDIQITAQRIKELRTVRQQLFGGVRGRFSQRFVNHLCPECNVNIIGDAGVLSSLYYYQQFPSDSLLAVKQRQLVPAIVRNRYFSATEKNSANGQLPMDSAFEAIVKPLVYSHFELNERFGYVAINCAKMMGSNFLYGRNEAAVRERFVKAVARLQRIRTRDSSGKKIYKRFHIVLYPLWIGEIDACNALRRDIVIEINNNNNFEDDDDDIGDDNLVPPIGDQRMTSPGVAVLPVVHDTPVIGEILRHAAFSFNYRLHANILSASYETPFIALAYTFKAYEMADYFGMNDFVFSTADFTTDQIYRAAQRLLSNSERDSIREKLHETVQTTATSYDVELTRFVAAVMQSKL